MAEQWTLLSRQKEDQKWVDNKRTAQPYNKVIHFSQMATKKNSQKETLHVFYEQVDRNVRPWLRNARPNVETPVQHNKTVEKCEKMFAFQTQQMQIFAVGHSVNPTIDRYNDFVSLRKCTDTNFFFTYQDETSNTEEKRPDISCF